MQSTKTVIKFCICLLGLWGLALVGQLSAQASEDLTPAQALAKAIETNDAPEALQAIKSGASLVQRDFIGFQPLHYAAFLGKPDMVKLLLDSGAPLNGLAKDSRLALAVAASEGRLEVVKLLLAAGADLNDSRGYNTVYRAKNVTALMEAAASNRTEVISYLIAQGADPNLLDSNRDPALNYAAYTGAVDAAILLLKSGSIVSIKGFGGTALDLAERQTGGKPELATFLKSVGAKRAAELGKTSAD